MFVRGGELTALTCSPVELPGRLYVTSAYSWLMSGLCMPEVEEIAQSVGGAWGDHGNLRL